MLATFVYNKFNSPNLANYSPYELVFGRKPKMLFNLETVLDIKVSGTFKDYHKLLNKRLKYLHDLLQIFNSKRIAMIIKTEHSFNTAVELSVYNFPIDKLITYHFKKNND